MKVQVHTETERKYELDPDAELPVLGLSDKRGDERLEAVYYDTADLRLARRGVTLRRRSGGPDAGWHLKVPAEQADSREEIRHPLTDGDTPPAELTELLTAHLRGAALGPVARITTRRGRWHLVDDAGRPLAEVTDDRVTGASLTGSSTVDEWREVEVELTGKGDTAVLDRAEERLRAAGIHRAAHGSKLARVLDVRRSPAGGDTAGDAVLAYLRRQVDALTHNDLLARRDAPDAVHRLRVAIRRTRSALRVFGRIVDRDRTRRLEEELRWAGRRLSAARDLEVLEEEFRAEFDALPAELVIGPVRARLTRHFGPKQAAAAERVRKTLRGKRYLALLDQLDRLLTQPPLTARAAKPAKTELPRHIRRAYRKTAGRMREVERMDPGPARDTATHSLRKSAKRLRYGIEAAAPALGGKAGRTRKRVKALTKTLGEFQDSVVARPRLRELGVQAHLAGENGFTFGLLHARQEHRAASAERELPDRWRKVRKNSRAWFR